MFPYVFISCFNKFLRSAIHLFCSTIYVWSSFLYWSNSLFIFVVLLVCHLLEVMIYAYGHGHFWEPSRTLFLFFLSDFLWGRPLLFTAKMNLVLCRGLKL